MIYRKSDTHARGVGIVGELLSYSLALKEPTPTTLLHLFYRLVGNYMFVKVGAAAIYSAMPVSQPTPAGLASFLPTCPVYMLPLTLI